MKKIILFFSLCWIVSDAVAAPYEIKHLEPENWWVGMKYTQVELMVHGENISATTPAIKHSGVTIVDTQKTDNPNYLFVTVDIAAATKPGKFVIDFTLDGVKKSSFPFHILSDSLDGFGILASGTFLNGEIDYDGEKQRIPGLSKESYQLTVYFEKAGFEFRVSGRKRDSYLTEERGVSLALTPAVDQGSELWDAQIGYNFAESGIDSLKGLTLTLQAQNLTNEKTVTTQETDARQVNRYQNFGANYLLGASYKF